MKNQAIICSWFNCYSDEYGYAIQYMNNGEYGEKIVYSLENAENWCKMHGLKYVIL